METSKLRWVFSGGALLLAVVHLRWPSLTIDTVTTILIIVAVLPWFSPLIKSLELPGIGKVELQSNAFALANPLELAARVGEAVHRPITGPGATSQPRDNLSTVQANPEERFYAGARAGVKSVAKLLEDLSITVNVGGEQHRRDIGRDLAAKLFEAADLAWPPTG